MPKHSALLPFQATGAQTGSDALQLLRAQLHDAGEPGWDIILKEHEPPNSNAAYFLRKLQGDAVLRNVPVVGAPRGLPRLSSAHDQSPINPKAPNRRRSLPLQPHNASRSSLCGPCTAAAAPQQPPNLSYRHTRRRQACGQRARFAVLKIRAPDIFPGPGCVSALANPGTSYLPLGVQ